MVCVRTAMYYMHLSECRFDFSERRAKQHRWEKATEEIRSQKAPPELAGVPGIGVPPPVPSRLEWWAEVPSTSQAHLQRP